VVFQPRAGSCGGQDDVQAVADSGNPIIANQL
jgi:hypothetical protein